MKRAGLRLAPVVAWLALASSARAGTPQVTKGPYLTGLSGTTVDVRFELDASAPAGVDVTEVGADAGATRTATDGPASMHVVHVAGLEPGRAYEYAVRAGGGVIGKGHFATAPKDDAPDAVTFLAYGDDRNDDATHAAIVRAMQATPSDFLVNTGDMLADGGNPADWQSFLRDRPLFLAIGNHELSQDESGSNFLRYFGYPDGAGTVQPFGTIRWGSARLFFLNGMHDWKSGPERRWLETELGRADAEPGLVWRIAVVHHGPWSSGPHGGNNLLIDARVPELLAAHHVDLVLAGHDHLYDRGDAGTLKYVVTGGGGAPLYPVKHRSSTSRHAESAYHFVEITLTRDSLKLVAHRLDGTALDTCGFAKGGGWDCDARPKADAPALAGQAPGSDASPASSRCSCTLPGVSGGGVGEGLLALGIVGMVACRRRRG